MTCTQLGTITSLRRYRLPCPAKVITHSPFTSWSPAKCILLLGVHCKNLNPHGFSAANPLIMIYLACREDMLHRNSSFCILPSLSSLLRADDLGTVSSIFGSNTHVTFRALFPCYSFLLLLLLWWSYICSHGVKGSQDRSALLHYTRASWEELCKVPFVCFTWLLPTYCKAGDLSTASTLSSTWATLYNNAHLIGCHWLLFYCHVTLAGTCSIAGTGTMVSRSPSLISSVSAMSTKHLHFFQPALQKVFASGRLTLRTKSKFSAWVKETEFCLDLFLLLEGDFLARTL